CNILTVPANLNSPNTKCDRDVEGAKKLLDDAGYVLKDGKRVTKDGVPLTLYFSTNQPIAPGRAGDHQGQLGRDRYCREPEGC
ncbi:MAG: hypothetical protein SH847_13565, partial [Roseiflexaceae bacterium]|nr:hypothetical protein [Roseiflexaceae bacterium]